MDIYTKAWVLVAYGLTTTFLVLGTLNGGRLWFGAGIVLFLAWDLGWLSADEQVRDRSAKEMMESSTRARTYMSWFLAVYGAILAFFLFQSTDAQRRAFFDLCKAASLDPLLFAVPFALTGLVMMFFPIALGVGTGIDLNTKIATTANLSVLLLNASAQKVTIYAFLYGIMRLLYHAGTQVP